MDFQTNQQDQSTDTKNRGSFWGGLLAGILLSLLVITGAFVVRELVRIYSGNTALVQKGSEESSKELVTKQSMEKLELLESVIHDYYYKEDVSTDDMVEGMYKGVVDSIGDAYSTYYTAEEYKNIMETTEGIYFGIGAYVSLDPATETAMISGVIDQSPAQEAELREGDIIIKVGDQDTQGMDLNEVVSLIKGPEGTMVDITIFRAGAPDYIQLSLERKQIESPTVEYEMMENGIGYLRIKEFDTVTYDQFMEGMAVLNGSGMKGLILDLRTNPGGNLNTVVDIARQMLPKGLIVYTEDRDKKRVTYSSEGENIFDKPLIVMINGYSASASEILAGAIKDYEMGELLGTTTFGKGIVQSLMPLADGTAIKLTVSAYYTPKGNNIHGVGIAPDIECEFDGEKYYDDGTDNQLDLAIEKMKIKIQE